MVLACVMVIANFTLAHVMVSALVILLDCVLMLATVMVLIYIWSYDYLHMVICCISSNKIIMFELFNVESKNATWLFPIKTNLVRYQDKYLN